LLLRLLFFFSNERLMLQRHLANLTAINQFLTLHALQAASLLNQIPHAFAQARFSQRDQECLQHFSERRLKRRLDVLIKDSRWWLLASAITDRQEV
jgi:hypothetical protein